MKYETPEPEPVQEGICYWKLNIGDIAFICWSIGALYGMVGAFTSRTILTRRGTRDEGMVVAVARPIT